MPVKIVSPGVQALELNSNEMTRAEFDGCCDAFEDNFKVYGVTPVLATLHHFPFAQLRAEADRIVGQPHRFLVIHFGLDEGHLRYGISFTYGTPIDVPPGAFRRYRYETSIDEPTHILRNNVLEQADPEDWDRCRSAYASQMRVRRGGSGSFEQLRSVDGLRVIFPWEDEVHRMYHINAKFSAENYRIVIDSVSMSHLPQQGDDGAYSLEGHRHGVALYVEFKDATEWVRMLNDDEDTVTIYSYKAADYGNMCPVRCNYYEERR